MHTQRRTRTHTHTNTYKVCIHIYSSIENMYDPTHPQKKKIRSSYVDLHIHTCITCIYIYTHTHVYMYTQRIHTCITCIYTHTRIARIHMSRTYACIRMHIIYKYISMYVYIHTHAHMHTSFRCSRMTQVFGGKSVAAVSLLYLEL
jgi:hypothetical protein